MTQPLTFACGSASAGARRDGGAVGDGTAGSGGSVDGSAEAGRPAGPTRSRIGELGPLLPADENGLLLPEGFTSRVLARAGEPPVGSSSYLWHGHPDGGATFPAEDGGWIYVSNSELPGIGGVGALRFDAGGELVDAYPILEGSNVNCAGGPTPWGTWLSCEEVARGRVWECDPTGRRSAIERPALGIFKHEAAAVDPVHQHVYLTEDERDGCFYRYVPDARTNEGHADLTAGRLEVAEVHEEGRVTWHPVPDPAFGDTPTRQQVPESTVFNRGEGIWYHDGVVYLATTGDDRVWAYDIATGRIDILYDRRTSDDPILRGVDNLTGSCCGDVLVAEDGGDMQIIAILPDGRLQRIVQVAGHENSEMTGPAFDPSGTRLYFSSQRGPSGRFNDGWTYEVKGPFMI